MSQHIQTLLDSRKIGLAALFILVLVSITSMLMPAATLLLMVGLLVIAIVVVCLAQPTWTIWLILGLLFFGDRSDIPQLVLWGRYLPTVGVALFVFSMMLRRLMAGNWCWKGIPLIISYTLFTLVVLISAIYNHSSTRDILLSLLTNLRYPLFFVMLLNADLPLAFYRQIIKAFVGLSLLQIPVTLVQFALLGQKGDSLTGTFASNANLVAVILISQFILIAEWLTCGKQKWYSLPIIGILLVPCLLADVQIVLIFFPIVAVFMLLRHYGLRRIGRFIKQSVNLLLLSMIVILIAFIATPSIQDFLSRLPVHLQYLISDDPWYLTNTSVGRITIMRFALPMLFDDPLRIIWGFGPEATYGGLLNAVLDNSQPDTSSIPNIATIGVVCQQLAMLQIGCREPQGFRAVMDFGLLGCTLYIFPQFLLWHASARIRLHMPSSQGRAVPLLFEGISLFYVFLGMWYIGVWRLDSYSFMFWLIAAAIFAKQRVYAADARAAG